MIDRTVLRLMVSIAVPIASACLMEQLPKTRVAQVPFAFRVEERTFPAGPYAVIEDGLGRSIRIQNQELAAARADCAKTQHRFGRAQAARLVFDNYDGQYRLAEIWFDADGRGVILPAGSARGVSNGETKYVWLR